MTEFQNQGILETRAAGALGNLWHTLKTTIHLRDLRNIRDLKIICQEEWAIDRKLRQILEEL